MSIRKALVSWAIDKKFSKIDAERSRLYEFIETLGPDFAAYNARLEPAREKMLKQVTRLYDATGPEQLLVFLVYFNAQGYRMTQPVPDWIRRAGAACKLKGHKEIGDELIGHAAEEEGHHLLMKKDFESLVALARKKLGLSLDGERIFEEPPSQGVIDYVELHEQCIRGPTPYEQISIETEIEFVSVVVGPEFVTHVVRLLGVEVTKYLSFVTSHTAFDVGHSRQNFAMLDTFMKKEPASLEPLARAGIGAVESYGRYLDDCNERAAALLAGAGGVKAMPS